MNAISSMQWPRMLTAIVVAGLLTTGCATTRATKKAVEPVEEEEEAEAGEEAAEDEATPAAADEKAAPEEEAEQDSGSEEAAEAEPEPEPEPEVPPEPDHQDAIAALKDLGVRLVTNDHGNAFRIIFYEHHGDDDGTGGDTQDVGTVLG